MLGVHNAEKKQANGDFHKGERDERLDPVGPADHLEQSSLRRFQVILMSSQAVDNLRGNQPRADQRRDLIKVGMLMTLRQVRGSLSSRRVRSYHGGDCNIIICSQVVCYSRTYPYAQYRGDECTGDKSPADCQNSPSLIHITIGRGKKRLLLHDRRRNSSKKSMDDL